MTEQAGIEQDGYELNVNFEGHHPDEVVLQQVALGYVPALLLTLSQDDVAVNFNIDVYGTPEIRGLLEATKAVIDTLLDRDLSFPEGGAGAEGSDIGDAED